MRDAFYEVGSAIQWVDDPLIVSIFTADQATFLGHNAVVWIGFLDGLNDHVFRFTINVGYKIVHSLLHGFNFAWISKILDNNLTSTTGSADSNIQHWMHNGFTTGC